MTIEILSKKGAWFTIQYPDGETAKICGKKNLDTIISQYQQLETSQNLYQESIDEITRLKLELEQANQKNNKLNEVLENVQSQSTLHNQTNQQTSVQGLQCQQNSDGVPTDSRESNQQEDCLDSVFEGGTPNDSSMETESTKRRESFERYNEALRDYTDASTKITREALDIAKTAIGVAAISIHDQYAILDSLEQSEPLSLEPHTIDVPATRTSDE